MPYTLIVSFYFLRNYVLCRLHLPACLQGSSKQSNISMDHTNLLVLHGFVHYSYAERLQPSKLQK